MPPPKGASIAAVAFASDGITVRWPGNSSGTNVGNLLMKEWNMLGLSGPQLERVSLERPQEALTYFPSWKSIFWHVDYFKLLFRA